MLTAVSGQLTQNKKNYELWCMVSQVSCRYRDANDGSSYLQGPVILGHFTLTIYECHYSYTPRIVAGQQKRCNVYEIRTLHGVRSATDSVPRCRSVGPLGAMVMIIIW